MKKIIIATFLSLIALPAYCGQMSLLGAGNITVTSSYSGPGDIVSGALFFGSCARAYNAAYANGTNSLCDLVDSAAPTTVICTLRVLTTGFVDLTGTYCTGGVTPATKCAAATGAVCNVSRVYDQTGNARHADQATAANQPTLLFSGLNSFPTLVCNGSTSILSTPTITQNQPFSAYAVYTRTSGTANGSAIGAGSGAVITLGASAGPNNSRIGGSVIVGVTGSPADGSFHYLAGTFNTTSSAYNLDGTDTTGQNFGTSNFTGNALRMCSDNAAFLLGRVAEGGLWPTGFNATNRGDMNTNIRSSNGYGSF